jgi:hypothetical protein
MSGEDEYNETKVLCKSQACRVKNRKATFCPPSENIVDAVRVLIGDWYIPMLQPCCCVSVPTELNQAEEGQCAWNYDLAYW